MAKLIILTVLALAASAQAGLLSATGAYVAPYASTYHAHHIDHAVAYPVAPAPLAVASPAIVSGTPLAFAAPAPVNFAAHAHAPIALAAPGRVGYAAHAPAPLAFAGHHHFAAPAPYYF